VLQALRPFICKLQLVAVQSPAIRHKHFSPTRRKRTLAAKRSMLLLMSCGSKVSTRRCRGSSVWMHLMGCLRRVTTRRCRKSHMLLGFMGRKMTGRRSRGRLVR
jgi:hypothetical protein